MGDSWKVAGKPTLKSGFKDSVELLINEFAFDETEGGINMKAQCGSNRPMISGAAPGFRSKSQIGFCFGAAKPNMLSGNHWKSAPSTT
jgi:hypothetical protein